MVIREFTRFLGKYFGDNTNLVGVEVGVWCGDNALSIIESLKPKIMVLVDAWNDVIEKVEGETQKEHFLSTYQKFANRIDVILVKGKSEDVAKLLCAKFDFVYIDANHDDIRTDIKCWYPLVKNGGILGGHDYNMENIQIPVREMLKDVSYAPQKIDGITWQGIDWWIIKYGN